MGPLANAFLAARREQQPCASTRSSHGYQGKKIMKALSKQAEKEAVEDEKSDGESSLPKTPLNNETHEVIDDLVLPCLYVLGQTPAIGLGGEHGYPMCGVCSDSACLSDIRDLTALTNRCCRPPRMTVALFTHNYIHFIINY